MTIKSDHFRVRLWVSGLDLHKGLSGRAIPSEQWAWRVLSLSKSVQRSRCKACGKTDSSRSFPWIVACGFSLSHVRGSVAEHQKSEVPGLREHQQGGVLQALRLTPPALCPYVCERWIGRRLEV